MDSTSAASTSAPARASRTEFPERREFVRPERVAQAALGLDHADRRHARRLLRCPPRRHHRDAFILYDPDRGTDDYFIAENRTRTPGAYDQSASGKGLVIWRVADDRFGVADDPIGLMRQPGTSRAGWDAAVSPSRTDDVAAVDRRHRLARRSACDRGSG